jgi:hypothetical protein
LELEQNPGFANSSHSASPMISVGLFGHEQAAAMEEDTEEQHSEHARGTDPSLVSSAVGRNKTAHFGHGNKNV